MRLVQSKVKAPALASDSVVRPRLNMLLNELLARHQVVTVAATAGAGKTTAIHHALNSGGVPYSWLSLGQSENDPERLVTHLAASLERRLPGSWALVQAALGSGVSHREAVELLVESLSNESFILVVDNTEVLFGYDDAIDLLGAIGSMLPPGGRLLLAGRTSLPLRFRSPKAPNRVGRLDDRDLALTVTEAEALLKQAEFAELDVEAIVRSTGGWVAGVLLEAQRGEAHVAGLANEEDPLYGYLAAEVLGQVDERVREFLVLTSLLDEVTVKGARALGLAEATSTIALLKSIRLPVQWRQGKSTFRCYPAFHGFLRDQFERHPDRERERARMNLARSLVRSRQFEEAVDLFISLGEVEEARQAAERCIVEVVLRSELEVAERWLDRLGDVQRLSPEFAKAEMLLSLATDNYARGAAVCDRMLNSRGGRRAFADSPELVALSTWLYTHQGRAEAIWDVFSMCRPGSECDIVKYVISGIRNEVRAPGILPELTGSVFDALLMRARYDLGDIGKLLEAEESNPWVAGASAPWKASALLAAGRIAECSDLIKNPDRKSDGGSWLSEFVEPKFIAETGNVELALARLRSRRHATIESGSVYRVIVSLLAEVEIRLQHQTGTETVPQLLNAVASYEAAESFAVLREQRDTLTGLMHLMNNQVDQAVPLLRRAVESMVRGHRMLHLPSAAVYLSEALWRIGEPDEADAAATTALAGAAEQGTNHGLRRALTLFPEVVARRLDAEPSSNSEWSRIARSLPALAKGHALNQGMDLHLIQFGQVGARLNDSHVDLGLRKAHELLALLDEAGPSGLNRQLVLARLFDAGTEKARGAYLRQITLRLRQAIPGLLDAAEGVFRLSSEFTITSEFDRVTSLQRQAASERGPASLGLLTRAIALLDGGEYMPGCNSGWVVDRREALQLMAIDIRAEAAHAAIEAGNLLQADDLAEAVLAVDPYRERMWQTRMQVAAALGDSDGVVRIYRECEAMMATIQARPTRTTSAMLENLRR
ncbi:hypothetical protein LWC35_37755 [Pseudonocardia kujensis]|uniref:BTAD domain-containing putative transcriptional regulator n=1 Tax=Pseudonocardia kujensis TaxID=1128675 RepID=UPI001E40468F|nr:BTAD domain-containing putative transcriptional regulator [Pseudonocardia kujensis]MCE0768599.1 hypothetical protein [Pseudonocardia kujensis]